MSKKISFIIPAFNAEQYIESCLSRIFSVRYENYDVIVVDDGSTDRTASILALINNPKLKVIRQYNSGVSAARNAGMAMTDADYVVFIDVDDILLYDQLDKLLCKIQFDRDVYMYAYEHKENGKIRKMPLPLKEGNYEKEAVSALCTRLLDVKYAKHYQSSYFGAKIYQYMFSMNFLRTHGILFPEGIPFAEDCVFCYNVFFYEPSLSVVDLVAYRYIVYADSASHKYRPNFLKEIKAFHREICKVNNEYNINNDKFFYYYFTDIIERAVSMSKKIKKKEAFRMIKELYSDIDCCTAAGNIDFQRLTFKEKIIKYLYKVKNPVLTYLFFKIVIETRKIKKKIFNPLRNM